MVGVPANGEVRYRRLGQGRLRGHNGRGDGGDIQYNDQQSAGDVEHDHDRHHHTGHPADALDAPQDDQCRKNHQGQSGNGEWYMKRGFNRVGDGIGLDHVADAESGHRRKHGKQGAQPFPAQALGDVIHGAAAHIPLGVPCSVFDRQHRFAVLGGHPHQPGHPHPEQRAGASGGNGRGHTGNVAGAHGGRKGRHQGLKMGDVAGFFRIFLAFHQGQPQGIPELPELETPQGDGQIKSGAHQENQHRRPPDKGPEFADQHFDGLENACFHSFLPFLG